MRATWLFAAALGLTGEVAAQETLHVGHVAPRTPSAGAISLQVGVLTRTLAYGEFAALDLDAGTHAVQALDAGSGEVLASDEILLRPDSGLTPVLYLSGDGARHPYRLVLDQALRGEGAALGQTARRSFVLHHEAPLLAADEAASVRLETDCNREISPLRSSFFEAGDLQFGTQWREPGPLVGMDTLACDVVLGSSTLGGFRFRMTQSPSVATRRAFLIGDAAARPAQVLLLDGAERVALLDLPPPQPRALAGSRDHWFDLVRPDQGLSLFEVGGTGIVFGTWFTLDSEAQPTWYYFEGAKVQGIGRRDVVVYVGSRAAGAQSLTPIGSGRLQYVDCNEVEFRVLLGERDFRTVRARRSQAVSFCPVFD
jgi:hypothetical protein